MKALRRARQQWHSNVKSDQHTAQYCVLTRNPATALCLCFEKQIIKQTKAKAKLNLDFSNYFFFHFGFDVLMEHYIFPFGSDRSSRNAKWNSHNFKGKSRPDL